MSLTSPACDQPPAAALRAALARVDWDFLNATTQQHSLHSLHWFPGNFIPQIPAYLIQLLSKPGDLVVDPFSGSGTTGVEALLQGRRVHLSDVVSAAIQVARGKISAALDGGNVCADARLILESLLWDDLLRSDDIGLHSEGADPRLKDWYHEDTLEQLRYLWRIIEQATRQSTREVLEMLFTDTLFACAAVRGTTATGRRRRHHWGWIADNVRPKKPIRTNAIAAFRQRVVWALAILPTSGPPPAPGVTIAREDARSLTLPSRAADLVVTSPPYLGMIDYVKANRLTYMWMGWALERDRSEEIGARYRRGSRTAIEGYLASMAAAVSEIARILKPGGFCAVVLGASRRYPQAAMAALDLFAGVLRPFWGPTPRVPTRRRVSDRRGSSPVEWLCVLRKDEQ